MMDYYKRESLNVRLSMKSGYADRAADNRKRKAYENRLSAIRAAITANDAGTAEKLLDKLDRDMEKFFVPKEPKPIVGNDIYVPTRMYLDHGEDDVDGGLAQITEVEIGFLSRDPGWIVSVKEIPGGFNYEYLLEHQTEWKKEYKRRRARPNPDYG